jgi:hypothetical protein
MNCEEEILKEHSRKQTVRIADWIGPDPDRFAVLMNLFLNGDDPLPQRAAWIVGTCGEIHPELAAPWIGKMLEKAADPESHAAIPRNIFRLLSCIGVPKKYLGMAVTICFDAIASPSSPIAVKANAIKILTDSARKVPGIRGELNAHLDRLAPDRSAGIQSICRNMRKELAAMTSGRPQTSGRARAAGKR